MEIINPIKHPQKIKAIIFDFDGTISVLRSGWESVMSSLMLETLSACPKSPDKDNLIKLVDQYINESTGIQTIFQMKWLKEKVDEFGSDALDPWEYKAIYNKRLMDCIKTKITLLSTANCHPNAFLIGGAKAFLIAT